MGSKSSKRANVCSNRNSNSSIQTQIGDDSSPTIPQKKRNLNSTARLSKIDNSSKGQNPQKNELPKDFNNGSICIVGEKQTGKTTLLNRLKGKPNAPVYPTNYPEKTIHKMSSIDNSMSTTVLNETDFETLNTLKGKDILNESSTVIFVILSDNNISLRDQIRKIAHLSFSLNEQKQSYILINSFYNHNDTQESLLKQVECLLVQYSINSIQQITTINNNDNNNDNIQNLFSIMINNTKLPSQQQQQSK